MNTPQQATGNPILEFAAARPFATTVLGGLLLFCSFAPIGWSFLAWFALIPWLTLVEAPKLSGDRLWLKVWLGGLLFWAAETYYVTIPHLLLWFAWIALFFYLSVYPLLFIWISRILVHDHRVPLVVAAPIVFTALEWVRAHVMGGFGVSMLANSQYQWTHIIQVCELAGAYGLTFLMVMVSTGLLMGLLFQRRRIRVFSVGVAMTAFAFLISYGNWSEGERKERIELQRTESIARNEVPNPVSVMVIQGNIDTCFPATQAEYDVYMRRRLTEYAELTKRNLWEVKESVDPELVIWPEGKYPIPDVLPWSSGMDDESMRATFHQFHDSLFWPDYPRSTMIVGAVSISSENEQFNAALLLDPDGEVQDRYFKMQRVPFGEYVPFSQWFPILEQSPIGRGIKAGDSPVSFVVGGCRFAPNICFESVVSHLIRDSVNQLTARGEEPDVLVNLTDDGWFYGTAALDHHLACNVMRAVENRKQVIVAANTGLSAFIDSSGKIVVQGGRRQEDVLEYSVTNEQIGSMYRVIGDWPPMTLAAICVVTILTRRRGRGWVERNREQQSD